MHDVVIVGAGPVGLFLAGELGLAGCTVLVLERRPDAPSPWRSAPLGIRGLSSGSVHAFYRRGMLAPLLDASGVDDRPDPVSARPRRAGHFAGMMLDPAGIDPTTLPFRLPGPALDGIMTTLDAVESVLTERAVKLGVQIRHGVTVDAVTPHADGVTVGAGGDAYRARWVVGCDGGQSAVRKLAGFAFTGTTPELTGYLVLGDIPDAEKLHHGFNLTPGGMYLRMPGGGYIGLLDFDGGAFDRSREPTREHLQEVMRRVSGTDVTLGDVRLVSTFTDRAMQATEYRRGRVLLAGDAAHIHSPLGGQGLNLGLGDAVNLGWKLAATVRGDAPTGLLDTYTTERHPIGARVLDWTRAQVAAMRPDRHTQALQSLLRQLIRTPGTVTTMFAETDAMTGLSLRYDLGAETPLTGHNAPDFHLSDGTRLGDLMHGAHAVLLDFTTDQHLYAAAAGWPDRLRYVAGPAHADFGTGAVLVRPDGIVAWAGDPIPDPAAFARAAARWLGDPRH